MKHIFKIFFWFILVLSVLSGCTSLNQKNVSSPGSVLGLNQSDIGTQKIVSFEVIGKGLEPEKALTKGEAILMAERAAIADGYRQLVEKLRGVYVNAFTKAGYGTVNQDMITTKTQSWLRGVEILEIRQAEYGITEAQLQLRIYFEKKDMVWWPSGLGYGVTPFVDQYGRSRQTSVRYDGN
ncbi:MAG: hypothetical protein GY860_14315 [Desulfobacteraceae bacterium]|nr:hypothetical protein [Desulfobacteraceae bacterium]